MNEDAFARHEVLDRAHIIQELIAGHLLEHPVVLGDPELSAAARQLHQAAFNLYQLCGRKSLEVASPEEA